MTVSFFNYCSKSSCFTVINFSIQQKLSVPLQTQMYDNIWPASVKRTLACVFLSNRPKLSRMCTADVDRIWAGGVPEVLLPNNCIWPTYGSDKESFHNFYANLAQMWSTFRILISFLGGFGTGPAQYTRILNCGPDLVQTSKPDV